MQAVFEKCWEPGGMHMKLVPLSWVFGILYSFGIPFMFYTILITNKDRVQADLHLWSQMGKGQIEFMTEKQLHDIKDVFSVADKDGSGTLSIRELRVTLSSLGMKTK